MPFGLTPKQHELLAFIAARLAQSPVPPSYDEMMRHLGLRSKGGVARLIDGLVERGHLLRVRYRHRGISLRLPGDAPPVEPAEVAQGSGLRVHLGPTISARLLAHCRQNGSVPADVILAALRAHIGGGR